MFKKIWNIFLLSNGISTDDEKAQPRDKWADFRAEREQWEHEKDLENAASLEKDNERPGGGVSAQK